MKRIIIILTCLTMAVIAATVAIVILSRTPPKDVALKPTSTMKTATTTPKVSKTVIETLVIETPKPTPAITPNQLPVNANADILLQLENPRVLVNGALRLLDPTNANTTLMSENGTTLIPLAFMAEATGAQYVWDAVSGTASLTYPADTIRITSGESKITAKGRTIGLGAPITAQNGQLLVPVLKMCQALNMDFYIKESIIYIHGGKIDASSAATQAFMDSGSARITTLKTVGNLSNLVSLMKSNNGNWNRVYFPQAGANPSAASSAVAVMPTDQAYIPPNPAASQDDFSTTNVQVEGVDEGDMVKTDGKYIYKLTNESIIIANATIPSELKLAAEVKYDNPNFTPIEMYVDGNNLVLIGRKIYAGNPVGQATYAMVQIFVYDITDPGNPAKIRFMETPGDFASSRKIGPAIYVISNKSDYYYRNPTAENVLPGYRDSLQIGGETQLLSPEKIYYFNEFFKPGYLVVAGFNLDQPDTPMKIDAYLGAGTNIYASLDNLYVTYPAYAQWQPASGIPGTKTMIFKFSLYDGAAVYISGNSVPGVVHNQYSMDEYEGNFRITTTGDSFTDNWTRTGGNNAYVMNPELNIIGKIENMAPGETIYSVRFMGARGYMVTYKKVDPLFVLDFTDPAAPKILGQLKIPGFSDYLHPYDENHLIGFGKEGIDVGGFAWYQGMKVSVFDVTDPANPVEESKVLIGDRGTTSYLLDDAKALLFSKARNLLAFPVTLCEIPGKTESTPPDTFGNITFQGAYVYSIDSSAQITLKGRITHMTASDPLNSSSKYIKRTMYIGDVLYTISDRMIKANLTGDLSEIASLEYN